MIVESLDIFGLLVLAAFLAGLIDAIAGGGGLITVPVLLLAGLSPIQALATNKFQGLFGAATAALSYARKGHVDLKNQWKSACIAAIASGIGALCISLLDAELIGRIIPFLLIAIALFFALKPGLNDVSAPQRAGAFVFTALIVPMIAFYDGFFGPGTGSFFMIAFVMLAGMGILKATAHTKLLNFASNVGGFVVFAFAGSVVWKLGVSMAIAQVFGAYCGSLFAMKKGAKLIKPTITITCLALASKLLHDTYF